MRTIGPATADLERRDRAEGSSAPSERRSTRHTCTRVRDVRSRLSLYAELRAVVLALLAGRPAER